MTRRVALGVSGHRLDQLSEADAPRLARLMARTMDTVEAAAMVASRRESVRMTMVSALAEGADRFAAHAALARDWRLVAPLPFRVSRYLKDFQTPESRAEFAALLAAGTGYEPVGRGGYLVVCALILERADALMVLWNGAPPRGPGGTADVAARALQMGKPVIWIPVAPRQTPRFIAPLRKARNKSWRARFHRALSQAFRPCAQPPAMQIAHA
ncbi:MAG: hypothetical protein NW200_10305 [Hyphomonadaceae bacterium]|nr:hypothetical protein [Hyphomonadaceae bacterium]